MLNRPAYSPGEGMLPQNLDAEQAVLGSLLIDPRAIERISSFLRPDDFYLPVNAEIYRGILDLYERDMPADIVTLSDYFDARDRLDDIGGPGYLTSLTTIVPTSINVEYYARIVERLGVLRRLVDAGARISSLGFDERLEADRAMEEAEKILFEISRLRTTRDFQPLSELLGAVYDKLDHIHSHESQITGVTTGYIDLDRLTSGFQPGDLIILAARPSMGKCLTAGTLIDNPDTGERVRLEDYVQRQIPMVLSLSHSGHIAPARVENWIDSGVQPVFRVSTSTGRQVEVTGHHPFLTSRGWKPLHELGIGARIAVPRHVPAFGSDTSSSPSQARLLAYFLSTNGLWDPIPTFSSPDPTIAADYQDTVRLFLSSASRGPAPGNDPLRTLDPWLPIQTWLSGFDLPGSHREQRRFPPAVWRWSKRLLAEFLRALFSCDASIHYSRETPRIEFSTVSPGLAQDVHHALTRFGIVSILSPDTDGQWRISVVEYRSLAMYAAHIGWIGQKTSIHMMPPSAPIATPVAFYTATRQRYGAESGSPTALLECPPLSDDAFPDIYWDEIVSVQYAGEQQVYDLTVPGDQNFVANDVCVHNTSLALNMAHAVAARDHLPVGLFSIEMAAEQIAHRFLSLQAQVDSQKLRSGRMTDSEWDRLVNAIGVLSELPIFVDDTPALSTVEMRSKARRLHAEQGLGMLVVDYLQLMHGATSESRVQEISAISRSLKAIGRELNVPVLALSQLSRAPEQRPNHEPMLSDLRESGCLTRDTRVRRSDTGAEVTLGHLFDTNARQVPIWSLDESWQIVPAVMTHVFSTGVRMTYRLTLASGREIKATAHHRFRTVGGWFSLQELSPGVRLAVPPRFLPALLPGPHAHDAADTLVSPLQDILTPRRCPLAVRPGSVEIAPVPPAPRPPLLHVPVDWDTVVSIEPLMEEEVFDATVPGPHNFVANDIVVHNSIEQDADLVMFIYRDVVYNSETERPHVADILVAKHRNGPTGKVHLFFQESLMKFLDLSVRDDD